MPATSATPITATTSWTSNLSQSIPLVEVGDPDGSGEERADDGGDDADDDRQPDRDVLPTGQDEPGESADDGANPTLMWCRCC